MCILVFIMMCLSCYYNSHANTADHESAKQEANNKLLDTKKALNEKLQAAESETEKLKVGAQLTVRWHASFCIGS